jgi:hypothetical protein
MIGRELRPRQWRLRGLVRANLKEKGQEAALWIPLERPRERDSRAEAYTKLTFPEVCNLRGCQFGVSKAH